MITFRKIRIWFFLLLTGFTFSLHAQSFTITYDENAMANGEIRFSGSVRGDLADGLPVYRVELPAFSQLAEPEVVFTVESVRTETLPVNNLIPADFRHSAFMVNVRGQKQWFYEIIPVRNNNGKTELITGFSLEVKTRDGKTGQNRFAPPQAFESVLANGDVYKIAVQKTGVHVLDFNFLETKLGIKLNQIDPRNIKIYGNGGGRLPLSNSSFRPDDLEQNAILVFGEDDGKFDNTDYILFYAEGPDKWYYNEFSNQYSFEKNIYDDYNYYFLKIDNTKGIRMNTRPVITASPQLVLDKYESLQHYEEDKINLLGANPGTSGTGKEWYGDYYKGTREYDYTSRFDFTNMLVGEEATVRGVFAGRSNRTSSVRFSFGNNNFTSTIGSVNVGDNEATYAQLGSVNQKINFSEANPAIKVTYPAVAGDSEGWLDYIQVICQKRLVLGTKQEFIRHRDTRNVAIAAFEGLNLGNFVFWDVSHPLYPEAYTLQGNRLFFETVGKNKVFLAHQGISTAYTPVTGEKIQNQNLHQYENADMLVVYHPDFESAVNTFVQHRSVHSGLRIVAARIDQIYNEFSSGRQDPVAIRDMARMLYTRDPEFRYLLLFGDGSYDYKGIMPNLNRENFVPVYETDQSLNPINGFPSDDFFALLDEGEGSDLFGGLDISVGRLPVKNISEANDIVKKIIHYDTSSSTLGDWRVRTGYVADDEDSGRHIIDTDEIARRTFTNFPVFNQQKVYFDAFPQVSTAGDPRFPEANNTLNTNIFAGQLTLTYLGHGGPQGWAQERVLTLKDIKSWTNFDRMFLMITATCSFAAYDDPKIVSPGEEALLNAKGGAIALYSTTRAVFTNSNKELTDAVHRILYQKTEGRAPTFGQVLTDGKNKNSSLFTIENSRKFTLLGDPSQQLALPDEQIVITKINQKNLGDNTDTLKAMTFIQIEGYVADGDMNEISDFNGTLNTTIYDKKNALRTLQNDTRSPLFEFDQYLNIIFRGKSSVKDGKFSFGFWVPKDINYEIGNGRISMYASDGESRDAAGYTHDVLIGGSAGNGVTDDTPPRIEVFMNDESFVSGGITNENPLMLIKLNDDFGINVTGNAVGHDITSVLNDNNSEANVLNEFFEAETDSYKSGTVRFPLKNLEPGKHTIRVKAWDIANNSAEKSTEFLVVNSQQEFLERVINYPNPFSTNTRFEFEHDLNNTTLDIHVYIYSISGKLVKTIEHTGYYQGNRVNDVRWNGRDDYEDRIARGVYLYKIKVHARELNLTRESKFEKLVIL